MANANYYDNLDLRYPEVGIALQRIDRMKPGKVAFSIPVLSPTLNNNEVTTNKVVQKDKSKVVNDNKDAVDVSNLEISNSILIEIPQELCCLPGAHYDITGRLNAEQDNGTDGTMTMSGTITINGNGTTTGNLNFNGTIGGSATPYGPVSGASFGGSGGVRGATQLSGTCKISGTVSSSASRGNVKIRQTNGRVGLVLSDSSRYIEKGSKWLIIFIGGDPACPAVIARLPDSADEPITEANLEQHMPYEEIDGNFGTDPWPDRDLPSYDVPDYVPDPEPEEPDESE